jgi:hypothetical protein
VGLNQIVHLTQILIILEQAGVDLKNVKPRNIVMPVNPRYTWKEWQEIFAAQVPSPGYTPNYKKGTEPQPGKTFYHPFE